MRRAQRIGTLQLLVEPVDGDDLARAGGMRAEQRGKADAAEADDRHRGTERNARRVDDRADTRQHGAAEHRGDVRRQIRIDFHQRAARDHRVLGEAGNADLVVEQGTIRTMQAAPAAEQRAGAVGGGARLAQGGAALHARRAVAAARHEDQRNRVTALQVGDAGPAFFDDARRLVAEHHRHDARPVAVDDRKVGVAEAGGGDLHQHLARAGRIQLDGLDGNGARLRVGAWAAHGVEDCGANFHDKLLQRRDRRDAENTEKFMSCLLRALRASASSALKAVSS